MRNQAYCGSRQQQQSNVEKTISSIKQNKGTSIQSLMAFFTEKQQEHPLPVHNNIRAAVTFLYNKSFGSPLLFLDNKLGSFMIRGATQMYFVCLRFRNNIKKIRYDDPPHFQVSKPVILQIGQRFFTINHCLMQFVWNSCPQSSVPISSPALQSSCKITRAYFDFRILNNRKKGNGKITRQ